MRRLLKTNILREVRFQFSTKMEVKKFVQSAQTNDYDSVVYCLIQKLHFI